MTLTDRIKREAGRLGFSMARVCDAREAPRFDRLRQWLDRGFHGEMEYLASRVEAYRHPDSVLKDVRSIVMLTFDYGCGEAADSVAGAGRISWYARRRDYHDEIHDRLKQLADSVREFCPDCAVRGVVDTAPLMERDFAQLAGLGWTGKNTLLIHPQRGSFFFLAALLTGVELESDPPFEADHCGTCTACLDACPTDAFEQPYLLDATRCISYLTIEHRGAIPTDLRAGIGDWLFGCDVCQTVCPWNDHGAVPVNEDLPQLAAGQWLSLDELFELDDDAFRHRFRSTPLWRSKRRGLLRNAAIVLGNQGNQGDTRATEALRKGLDDHEPIVRGASAWALGRINTPAARDRLRARAEVETDEEVRGEIAAALGEDSR